MKTLENYYDQYKDPRGCKQTFLVLIILTVLILVSIFLCTQTKAQRWQDTNRGLYPNSLQGTINFQNEALGVRYSHLFQKPILGIPFGVYGSFSNTLPPFFHIPYLEYIYDWERKYSLGLMITLPYNSKMHGIHTMITVGAIKNFHPIAKKDEGLQPGQFSNIAHTTDYGCDLGVQIQLRHFTAHFATDMFNFMHYNEIGAGFTLYRLRK